MAHVSGLCNPPAICFTLHQGCKNLVSIELRRALQPANCGLTRLSTQAAHENKLYIRLKESRDSNTCSGRMMFYLRACVIDCGHQKMHKCGAGHMTQPVNWPLKGDSNQKEIQTLLCSTRTS